MHLAPRTDRTRAPGVATALAALLLAASPAPTRACDCPARVPSPATAAAADLVVEGRWVRRDPAATSHLEERRRVVVRAGEGAFVAELPVASFRVTRVFKGEAGPTLRVASAAHAGCTPPVISDEEPRVLYLKTAGGVPYLDSCSVARAPGTPLGSPLVEPGAYTRAVKGGALFFELDAAGPAPPTRTVASETVRLLGPGAPPDPARAAAILMSRGEDLLDLGPAATCPRNAYGQELVDCLPAGLAWLLGNGGDEGFLRGARNDLARVVRLAWPPPR